MTIMTKRIECHLRTVLLCTLAGLILVIFSSGTTGAASVNDIIDQVQKSYEKISDFKADFVQEMTLKTLKKTEREEGIVYFKNPKRMLWSYSKPKEKKLIINPKQAWLYMPDDRVVYLQSAEGIFKSRVIIKFLTGLGKIGDDFNTKFSKPDAVDGVGNFLLTITPKDNDMGVKELYLTIDKDTYYIVRCRFADDYGNVTQINFRNIEINKKIPDHVFTFKPPAGVDVIQTP